MLEHSHAPGDIAKRLRKGPASRYESDAILGGIDGCVSTFAIVSGAVGAGFSVTVALVMGFANLLADGFSMAVSNFEAVRSEREHIDQLTTREHAHISIDPDGEREEIRQIFAAKGFSGETLEEIVRTITRNRTLWIKTMLMEEYGLPSVVGSEWRSAATTFCAFVGIGVMPLVPLLIVDGSIETRYQYSIVVAALAFFAIGATKSGFGFRNRFKAGVKTLLTGMLAAGVAFALGNVLDTFFAESL